MAMLASMERPVIIRFCGISKGSADGLSLVQILCHQLLVSVLPPPTADHRQNVPSSCRGAVKLLHTLPNEHPVALFVDSLDQLRDKDLARSNIIFLCDVKPHPDTRIVVSALPDDKRTLQTTTETSTAATRFWP